MESRERYNLSLRKQNIEEYIFNRRIKTNNTNKSLTFEINPYDLDIDSTYKDFQITDIVIILFN